MKKLLFILVFLVLLLAAAGFYLLKPKALGVTYGKQALASAKEKLAVTYAPLPADAGADKVLLVSDSHPVDQTFSSQELTALADNRQKDFPYFPFKNVQIRVNADGSVEGSATVNYQDAVNYLVALGVSQEVIAEGAAKFKIPPTDLPVYLKVSGSITENTSQIAVAAAKIANLNIPQSLVDQYGPALNGLVESVTKDRQLSYSIETLEVVNGQVHFLGTSPDQEMAARSIN